MKVIALCFNTPGMDRFKWREDAYGKKYPGAGWMKYLCDQTDTLVMAGQSVIEHIAANAIKAEDVRVVQEENNGIGADLIGMGTDPRVLMCLESPIFASGFYDSLGSSSAVEQSAVNRSVAGSMPAFPANFKHRLLFDGGTEHLYFPSFDDEDIKDPVPWNDRKFLCMVTSNKHYSSLPEWRATSTRYVPGGTGLHPDVSPSFKRAMETQLHDYRYQAINELIDGNGKDLYGKGWPPIFASRCDDKLATIRNYKFCLCFENGSYPGYVTEKIIDCLVAGVIPVYRGAPNIGKYIPYSIFVDASEYDSFQEMEESLRRGASDENEFKTVRRLGQEWLRSSEGQRYNNHVFAKRILEMCE